eukprot:746239-Hanusia_phi.AAC.21
MQLSCLDAWEIRRSKDDPEYAMLQHVRASLWRSRSWCWPDGTLYDRFAFRTGTVLVKERKRRGEERERQVVFADSLRDFLGSQREKTIGEWSFQLEESGRVLLGHDREVGRGGRGRGEEERRTVIKCRSYFCSRTALLSSGRSRGGCWCGRRRRSKLWTRPPSCESWEGLRSPS